MSESPAVCRLAGSPITFTGHEYSARLGALVPEGLGHRGKLTSVLLVASSSFGRRWWYNRFMAGLRPLQMDFEPHDGIPTPESVTLLATRVAERRPDAVLAVGGGSVIDAAKCAAALTGQARLGEQVVRELCATAVGEPGIPVIAVPSTPGTGAEATPFATIWDRSGGRKLSVRGPALLPAAAVLDPDLLIGLPRRQAESCLLDALAQALEASWSMRGGEASETFATAALEKLSCFLRRRAVNLSAPCERAALMLAGHYSGRAIAIAGTTLCHALSYPMTLRHGILHGYACGVTLASVLLFNAAVGQQDCRDPRGPGRVGAAIHRSMIAAGAANLAELARRINELVGACCLSLPAGLIAEADGIALEALSYDRAGNNPRRADRQQLAALLRHLPGPGKDDDES